MKKYLSHIFVFTTLVTVMIYATAVEQLSPAQVEELRTEAKKGDSSAQLVLGAAYFFGEGVTKDLREATQWFRKAAEQGLAEAQYQLGSSYNLGQGVEKNLYEAVRWYRKAAEQGLAEAQYYLGQAYNSGQGIEKDLHTSTQWYRDAAKQGHADAQYHLGLSHYSGRGAEKDLSKSVHWWRKAAKQGHARAQFSLGLSYVFGQGVEKDPHEGVRWYREAAEQGLAAAQYDLGQAYLRGKGVEKDLRESVRWFRKAAEQDNADAQASLSLAYTLGEGVIVDYREAYIWASIAKASGNEKASWLFSTINWRNHLSQGEIRSAQKKATHRLQAIENRKEYSDENAASGVNTDTDLTPKKTNAAEQVFENTWRSVVVVVNGGTQGSGVIIRPNIVATNCHVVGEGGRIIVYKPANRRVSTESAFAATIRHSDRDRDFCLLDVDGLWGIPAMVRQYDTLKVGEDVYGLGAPQGLDLSLSDGLVSQLRKHDGQRMIQTNVAISPGSSGGGLFDSEGNLVGIMTSKITDKGSEGIGFAIPADLVLEF